MFRNSFVMLRKIPSYLKEKSVWQHLIAPIIVGLLVGAISTLITHYLTAKQWPKHSKWDLFASTYPRRIEIYGKLLNLFSDVYYLEKDIVINSLDKRTSVMRRLELHKKYYFLIGEALPFLPYVIYDKFFNALNFYSANMNNFTPKVRKQWVIKFFNPLVKAIRQDVGAEEIGSLAQKVIFDIQLWPEAEKKSPTISREKRLIQAN